MSGAAAPAVDVAVAVVGRGPVQSDVLRARGAGPLRLLCPRAAGGAAWIVTSSLGGGLVDGDALALEVTVEPEATCIVTSQASTKVYRGTSSLRTEVCVREGAVALVVPDPVVPFGGARFEQVTAIALETGASLAFADVVTAGRVAYGERWSAARVATTLELMIAGERVLLDRLLLERNSARRMRRFEAIGTAILAGPRFADIAAAELARLAETTLARGAPTIVAGSPLGAGAGAGAGAMFRVAGERVEATVGAIRELLRTACARAGQDPWARRW